MNIKFCVKIGKSASETSALLTVAYDEYAIEKSSVLSGIGVQGKATRCARRRKKWAAKNVKDRCKCGQSTNLGALRSKSRCDSNSRRTEYEQGKSATDCKGRFGNEKNFPQKWCLES